MGAGETKRSLGWLGRDGEEVRWLEEGGAWCGRSDRSGEGEHFWSSPENSPENFSGGGGGGRRRLGGGRPWLWWPDFMEGKSICSPTSRKCRRPPQNETCVAFMLPGREHECNGSFNFHCIRAPWQGEHESMENFKMGRPLALCEVGEQICKLGKP
ncbi:hypothetical protein Tco_0585933 [Tanacetum coccineum]